MNEFDILGYDDMLGDDDLLGSDDMLGDDDMLLGEFDLLGDESDLLGDDELGRLIRRRAARGRSRSRRGGVRARRMVATQRGLASTRRSAPPQAAQPVQTLAPWRSQQVAPGVIATGERMQPLPMGSFTFTANSGTFAVLTVNPQVPFRGERLVVGIARDGLTSTAAVVLRNLSVGRNPQWVTVADLPADVFAAGAFDTRLTLDAAQPGVDISLDVRLVGAALAGGDTIVVTAGLIGRALT